MKTIDLAKNPLIRRITLYMEKRRNRSAALRDMTHGVIWKQLVVFAVPLLLGNLLQQAYNAFDAIVVGNFVSNEALAAVGSAAPLINMIVSFFMGMSSGASVLISQYYGARNIGELRNTIHTSVLLAIIIGIVLSIIGVVFTPALLRLMQVPEEVFVDSAVYLRIYFGGLVATTIYNIGAAILTATGDSKRPLYFLMLATVTNVVLNLVFVLAFGMGVAGVAWSTVISQVICATLIICLLCLSKNEIRLNLKMLRIHKNILKRVVQVGLPGGIQSMIISASNVIVQSYINLLGSGVVAGYVASSRVDAFVQMPIASVTLATSTFVGQNLGAGQVKRAREGVRMSMFLGIGSTMALSVVVFIFGRYVLRAFTTDPQVISYGMEFMAVFVPSYFVLAFTQIIPGALRGAGDVKVPTVACIISFVFIRQVYLYFITKVSHSSITVALGYPITWLLAAIVIFVYYLRSDWSKFEREDTAAAG